MANVALPYAFPIRVRWAETDLQGIVFNGHYMTYFDVGVTEYMRDCGYPYTEGVERLGGDMMMVHAEMDYRAPARFDDEVEVQVTEVAAGNTSVTFSLAVTRGDEQLTVGKLVYVMVDRHTHEPMNVPDDLRNALCG